MINFCWFLFLQYGQNAICVCALLYAFDSKFKWHIAQCTQNQVEDEKAKGR